MKTRLGFQIDLYWGLYMYEYLKDRSDWYEDHWCSKFTACDVAAEMINLDLNAIEKEAARYFKG